MINIMLTCGFEQNGEVPADEFGQLGARRRLDHPSVQVDLLQRLPKMTARKVLLYS